MSVVRSAFLALVPGMVALWLVSSAFTDTPAQETSSTGPPASSPPVVDPSLFDLSIQAERLERVIGRAEASAPSRRNPFEFGHREIDLPPPVSRPDAALFDDAPAEGGELRLTLVGIAERRAGTPPRIAILAGAEELFLAAPGDTVGNRYRVVAVSADAVELRDEASSQSIRLVLP